MGKGNRDRSRNKDATGQGPILDLDPTLVIGRVTEFEQISKNGYTRLDTVFFTLDRKIINKFPAIGLKLGWANTGLGQKPEYERRGGNLKPA